ncbi:MAG: indole-3-glycerol phosphate synthase TrpC [Candidatus Omnitrophica bacterium]|nr:indole-3-glycerol phosphate synthase TrpC [Candidatus Omnitrophota bacterium]
MSENILSLILEAKKKKVAILKKNREGILSLLKRPPHIRSFKEAIERENKISIIAEIKQASPSAGIIRKDFSPQELAKQLEKGGASALSVLTEEEFFLGKPTYIEEVKKVVNLPILRKDFIIDEIQVLESRALGADAILLIMHIIDENKFKKLYELAKDLGMDVLVEVHTEKELKKVLKFSVEIIGINNRNLHTMKIDIERTKKLSPFIPSGVVSISESGISSLKDILFLKGLGINAVLVGEALMREANVEAKLKELDIDG